MTKRSRVVRMVKHLVTGAPIVDDIAVEKRPALASKRLKSRDIVHGTA